VLWLTLTAYYHIGQGCTVYPSQDIESLSELGDKSSKEKKEGPSRVLYKVKNGGIDNQAALHEQKIGNALRTIDSWHGDDFYGVTPVEPLGVVSTHMDSTRIKNERDFYTVMGRNLHKWSEELKDAKSLSDVKSGLDDLRFAMAVLVRGGLFA
jgi:CRISPR-associated protein Csy3